MNKTELIEHIAEQADISKAAAARALEAVIGGVKNTLKNNGAVTVVGFGTFTVTKQAARTGRNPRTGGAIKIKAVNTLNFRPSKRLVATIAGSYMAEPVVPEPEPDKRPPKKKKDLNRRSQLFGD